MISPSLSQYYAYVIRLNRLSCKIFYKILYAYRYMPRILLSPTMYTDCSSECICLIGVNPLCIVQNANFPNICSILK